MRKQQGRYYFFWIHKLINIRYLDFTSQKREPIKIAKKLLLARVILRKGQRHKAFAGSLRFSEQPTLRKLSGGGGCRYRKSFKGSPEASNPLVYLACFVGETFVFFCPDFA
jgi:hypothetical protein